MALELNWTTIAAIIVGLFVIKKFGDLHAELRVRAGRLGRQIDRLGAPESAQPCDIVLTQGHTFTSRAIRFFTRGPCEPRSQVNHVGIVVKAGRPPAEAIIVEALLNKVRRHSLGKHYGNGRSDVAIYRPTNLSCADKQKILKAAEGYIGKSYGIGKILLHFLDWFLLGRNVFRRLGRIDKRPICSWLVAHSYETANKHFGVDPGAATPDDIWDFVTRDGNPYKRIRELRPL